MTEAERTVSTRIEYNRKAVNLTSRFNFDAKATGDNFVSQSDYDFYERIMDYAENWKPKTWQAYKASLIYFFERSNPSVAELFRKAEVVYRKKREMVGEDSKVIRESTANVRKGISEKQRDILLNHLEGLNHTMSIALKGMVIGGITFGLRPSEWSDFELLNLKENRENNTISGVMMISNRKTTHERSNGEYRKVCFVLQKTIVSDILYLADVIKAFEQEFKEDGFQIFLNRARYLMRESRKKLFPKMKKFLTLYSFRHQFSANAKSARLTKHEIAALMGHGSLETATTHYGKRKVGWFKESPEVFKSQIWAHEETLRAVFELNPVESTNEQKKQRQ